jgi:hypothetical protein
MQTSTAGGAPGEPYRMEFLVPRLTLDRDRLAPGDTARYTWVLRNTYTDTIRMNNLEDSRVFIPQVIGDDLLVVPNTIGIAKPGTWPLAPGDSITMRYWLVARRRPDGQPAVPGEYRLQVRAAIHKVNALPDTFAISEIPFTVTSPSP